MEPIFLYTQGVQMLDLPKHLATYLIIDISLFIANGFVCSEFMDLNKVMLKANQNSIINLVGDSIFKCSPLKR